MKQVSMAVILISALTLTLVSTAIFSGIQQVRAENDKEEDNTQVNCCQHTRYSAKINCAVLCSFVNDYAGYGIFFAWDSDCSWEGNISVSPLLI